MKAVRVTMSDAVHANLMRKAAEANFPDIESYLNVVHVGEPETETLRAFRRAKKRFEDRKAAETVPVTVRDLMGDEWLAFDKAERIAIGKMFRSAVDNGLIFATVTKNSGGHAVYETRNDIQPERKQSEPEYEEEPKHRGRHTCRECGGSIPEEV